MAIESISLWLPNRPGVLRPVAQILAEGRINVASFSLSSAGARSHVRLVVDDTERALWLLRKAGHKVDSDEMLVVALEDRAGSFVKVLDVLAKHKLNLTGGTILVTRDRKRVLMGLQVANTPRARKLLQDAGFLSANAEQLVTNADLIGGTVIESETQSVGLLM